MKKLSFRDPLSEVFLNDENNLENIEEINLELIPKYNLNDYKILEKTDNCYFLEKFS